MVPIRRLAGFSALGKAFGWHRETITDNPHVLVKMQEVLNYAKERLPNVTDAGIDSFYPFDKYHAEFTIFLIGKQCDSYYQYLDVRNIYTTRRNTVHTVQEHLPLTTMYYPSRDAARQWLADMGGDEYSSVETDFDSKG